MQPCVTIYPLSMEAGGHFGGSQLRSTAYFSNTWGAIDRAVAYPFAVDQPISVVQLWVWNGTAVSGNFDIGIYSEDAQTKLISTGSTAQAGVSSLQSVAVGPVTIGPGKFWMVMSMDNTTGAVFRLEHAVAGAASLAGMRKQDSAGVPLPASLTLVDLTTSIMQFFGLSTREVL